MASSPSSAEGFAPECLLVGYTRNLFKNRQTNVYISILDGDHGTVDLINDLVDLLPERSSDKGPSLQTRIGSIHREGI